MAVELFISYDEADEKHLRALETALKPMERAGAVAVWHRARTSPGEDIEAHAARRFAMARVVVLLLSAGYLASDERYAEALRALERQKAGAARLLPIVVEPCDRGATALAGLQALPRGAAAISNALNAQQAWADVAVEVRELLGQLPPIAAVPAPTAPEPEPPAPRAQLRRRLWQAQAERERLLDAGDDDPKLRQEIREIKHKLREGGKLRAEDMLGDGRYRLLEHLGKGGFANVWRAAGTAEGREVAVKILHADLAGDTTPLDRFFRGARAMSRLLHPAVVRVLEPHGEDGGWHYFVMELVRGKNLRDAVLAGEVSAERVPDIILAVGEALAEAHRRGMVHRDVKPANILLDEAGMPKLTDFDLVTAAESTAGTRTGAMGTFLYAAPELMHDPGNADARADVFGLGMTAVFCWYGRELPLHVLRAPDKVLRELPCGNLVRQALSTAINWESEHRYRDATAFCEALRTALQRPSSPERPPPARGGRLIHFPHTVFEKMFSWVEIPAGEFLMGSPLEDGEAYGDERPQHRVPIGSFLISRTPITIGQYCATMGKDIGNLAPDLPITNVSWIDAIDFCNALSRLRGRKPCYIRGEDSVRWRRSADGFRLPTEAEWEYACRAGTTTRYFFGDDSSLLGEYAWFKDNSRNRVQPVGQKRPNAWGLLDMNGNVCEWVWDQYGAYEPSATNDVSINTRLDGVQVGRGGSYCDAAVYLRAAYRIGLKSAGRDRTLGFRCAAPPLTVDYPLAQR